MPGLQVVSAPIQPTLSPVVQSAPQQPTLAPKVVTQPTQPKLAPRVVTQPQQPQLSPQVQSQPQGQQETLPVSYGHVIDSIVGAKAQGASAQDILNEIIKQNPDAPATQGIQQALSMGADPNQILDKIIQDNYTPSNSTPSEKPSVGGFVSNVGKSGVDAVKNVLNAAFHPINTVEGIAKILVGAQEKTKELTHGYVEAIPGFNIISKFLPESYRQQSKDAFGNTVEYFKQRYGSVDNIKKTVYEDPVGFLIDLSTALDAGGSAIGKVGDVTKISELSKAGEVASKVGETVNPANAAGKAAKYGLGKVGNVASEVLGVETGAGGGAVREAFNNPSKGFYEGLRGKVSPEEIVTEAKDALSTAKNSRSSTYQKQLAEIKTNGLPLDLKPLQKELDSQLTKFGVQVDEKGNLNFDSSTISDPAEQTKIKTAYEDINRWGQNPKNLTPAGIDTLKRRLDNLYSPNSDVRALTTSLKSSARKILIDNVPGYADMTKAYQEATSFIDDVTKGLSLGDKASADTALRKLASTLKQNNEFRKELVSQLQEIGGKDLTGKIAGYNLSSSLPRGVFGKLIDGGAGYAALKGLTTLFHPGTLAVLATTSPRLVGEIIAALGLGSKAATEVINALQKSHAGRTLRGGAKAGYYEEKSKPSLRESKRPNQQ